MYVEFVRVIRRGSGQCEHSPNVFRWRVPSGGGSHGGSVTPGLVLSSDWWSREGAEVSYEELCG